MENPETTSTRGQADTPWMPELTQATPITTTATDPSPLPEIAGNTDSSAHATAYDDFTPSQDGLASAVTEAVGLASQNETGGTHIGSTSTDPEVIASDHFDPSDSSYVVA